MLSLIIGWVGLVHALLYFRPKSAVFVEPGGGILSPFVSFFFCFVFFFFPVVRSGGGGWYLGVWLLFVILERRMDYCVILKVPQLMVGPPSRIVYGGDWGFR